MRTKTLTVGETSITIRRPNYRAMRDQAGLFETLYGADSAAAVVFSADFDKAVELFCDTPEDVEKLQTLDVNEVWQVWEEFVEFARLEAFFHGAAEAQRARSSALFTVQLKAARARFDMMKKAGFAPNTLPSEFAVIEGVAAGE
jgi:hypothetical protein